MVSGETQKLLSLFAQRANDMRHNLVVYELAPQGHLRDLQTTVLRHVIEYIRTVIKSIHIT